METGVVIRFDAQAGFGAIRDEQGREHFFHCTQIAGGTRTISEGTRVVFGVRAGHGGRWEAAKVTPV